LICYSIQWLLWEYLWLAIPVWIMFYKLNRKYKTS
jgi:hypothetical protein